MIQETQNPQLTYSGGYNQPFVSLFNEDCIETMKRIPDGSIDLMLTDPPYNTTACEWEYAINFELLWAEWLRIVKPNGTFIFTASQPFTTDLIISNRNNFKYELIWEKDRHSDFLLAKYRPLKIHEKYSGISSRKENTYNPQLTNINEVTKKRYNRKTDSLNKGVCYGNMSEIRKLDYSNNETALPQSVLFFTKESNNQFVKPVIHPTQKPVDLMRYLILTYTNKGETVFDGYSGSGTTAEACIIEGRKFIGSELNKEYFDKSVLRLKNVPTQLF